MRGRTLLLATVFASALAAEAQAQVREGREIVRRDCGACHATGRFDRSRQKEAPPFRGLGRKYDVGDLAEALAEGISVGHPAMPEAVYEPDQIEQIIAYLRSLQPNPPRPKRETR